MYVTSSPGTVDRKRRWRQFAVVILAGIATTLSVPATVAQAAPTATVQLVAPVSVRTGSSVVVSSRSGTSKLAPTPDGFGSGPCSTVDGDYPCHGYEQGSTHAAGSSYVTDNLQNDNMSCLFDVPPYAPCHGQGVPRHGYREVTWLARSSAQFSNGTANRPNYFANFGAWNNTRLNLRWYIECNPFDNDPRYENISAHLIVGGHNSRVTPYHLLGIRLACDGTVQEIDQGDWQMLIPPSERKLNWHPHIEFAFNPNHFEGRLGNKYNISISAWSIGQSNPAPPVPMP